MRRSVSALTRRLMLSFAFVPEGEKRSLDIGEIPG
jgi:hypothetical protein